LRHVKKTEKKSFFFNRKSSYSHTGLLEVVYGENIITYSRLKG